MRPVAKRDNLYTLSLFALKLWLLRLKYNFILSSLKNDDIESSKRCVKHLSLIFILKSPKMLKN